MNPFHAVLIAFGYLVSVVVGRLVMKVLPRFELKTFSLLHNFFLIVLSTYMGVEISRQAYINNYSFIGNGVDASEKGVAVWKFCLFVFLILFVDGQSSLDFLCIQDT